MKKWLSACLAVCCAGLAHAGAHYDAAANRIWVTDYPAAAPCTLATLARIDRICGWNKVHLETGGVYRVDADLCIGADDGTETFFNIGAAASPCDTLVLNGNLFVLPCGMNAATGRTGINRLTLGSAADSNLSAVIQVASSSNAPHSVYVGVKPEGRHARGLYSGQLHMFNSKITALTQDAAHALGAPFGYGGVYLAGDSIRIRNSEISWAKGCLAAGLVMHLDTRIENTVFAHAGSALSGYKETPHKHNLITGCTFRDCEVALKSPHSLAVFSGCRFERNRRNWVVDNCMELTLMGCVIAPPLESNLYGRTDYAKAKQWQPRVVIKHDVAVMVRDPAGQPVANATVTITGRADGQLVVFTTGADGGVGGLASRGARLLARIESAVEGSEQPAVENFNYDLQAEAHGFQPGARLDFQPWAHPEGVVLVLPQARP